MFINTQNHIYPNPRDFAWAQIIFGGENEKIADASGSGCLNGVGSLCGTMCAKKWADPRNQFIHEVAEVLEFYLSRCINS